MSCEHVTKTIDLILEQISDLDRQLLEKKRMVNDLCGLADRQPVFADADLASTSKATAIRADEYYGKPLATVVREVLERRRLANLGAAAVNEIYEEMVAGGYGFGGKNDDNNKRGLYISLGKNSVTFHKLPNGTYGLRDWYPEVKDAKESKAKNNGSAGSNSNEKPLHEELQEAADIVVDDPVAATKTPK